MNLRDFINQPERQLTDDEKAIMDNMSIFNIIKEIKEARDFQRVYDRDQAAATSYGGKSRLSADDNHKALESNALYSIGFKYKLEKIGLDDALKAFGELRRYCKVSDNEHIRQLTFKASGVIKRVYGDYVCDSYEDGIEKKQKRYKSTVFSLNDNKTFFLPTREFIDKGKLKPYCQVYNMFEYGQFVRPITVGDILMMRGSIHGSHSTRYEVVD